MDESNPSTTSGVLASSKAEAPRGRDPHSGSGRLEVRCPNCHTPMEVAVDTLLTDLTCSVCGSHFSLVDQSQATRMAPPLSTMGRFELIERLGVGGFGSVWKARDRELDRTVAIKIPRQGGMTGEEQEKFLREARAAAQLRHPNIVSVHEVGRDVENVYIVSDFVRGVTLGDWLTGQTLTSRESAELCAKIAEALHHAHEQGVVHRDLKPANIMIDGAGEPHLMDFGLARRDAGEVTVTLDGEVLGTPAYMSPEQALGESHTADRRSDVYSLGVILFQLLTGELPFRGNARMIMHQVIHDDAPSPRKLNAFVSDDLETITLKCLVKEPGRRYSTARDLTDDLRRFLTGEPIQARPISHSERAARWVRRNPAVSALSAAVVAALVTGTVVSAYFAKDALRKAALALAREHDANVARSDSEQRQKEAEQARAEETRARREAEAVTSFLVNAFDSPDPARDGRSVTVAEVLDRAEGQIDKELVDQPLTQARLLLAIGRSRLGLGMWPEAIPVFTKAKNLRYEFLGPGHRDTLESTTHLAAAYAMTGRLDEALPHFEQALQAARRTLGADDLLTLAAASDLASTLNAMGRSEEAISLLEDTVKIMRAKLSPEDPRRLAAVSNLALFYTMAGRRDEAIALQRQAYDAMCEKLGDDHPMTLRAMHNLGKAHFDAGGIDEAIALYERELSLSRTKLGADHPDTLHIMNDLGLAYYHAGRLDDAIQLHEETVAGRRRRLGPNDPNMLTTMANLGYEYYSVGRHDDAMSVLEETLEKRQKKLGADHPDTLMSMSTLAGVYSSSGRSDQAVSLAEKALAGIRQQRGPNHRDTLISSQTLAAIYCDVGRQEDGISLLREVVSGMREHLGPEHPDTRAAISRLASAYREAGRPDHANELSAELFKEAGGQNAQAEDPKSQSN